MTDKEKPGLFDDQKNIKRLIMALWVVCGSLLVLEFVIHRHVDHLFENLWAFYALFGFAAYTAIVFGAAALRKILMREEDYYDD